MTNSSFLTCTSINSCLDSSDTLLYGLPANQLNPFQKIQNTAARILTFSMKSCHFNSLGGFAISIKEMFLTNCFITVNVLMFTKKKIMIQTCYKFLNIQFTVSKLKRPCFNIECLQPCRQQ